ncbi:MAG: hypothetical protein HYW62_00015 [Candidatus Levybacteria bacterium]|nr:hypothetical protein [Candidatus Levybacteria bacterium]
MNKPESEPEDKDLENLKRKINEGLARIAKDPDYKEEVMRGISERLAELHPIDKLKPLKHEDPLIAPELMDAIAEIITERVMNGSLDPAGLKKVVSDPNNFPALMQEGTARLLKKPRVIKINPN